MLAQLHFSVCSSSRARQVCSNNLRAHSSSRGSMVRLQGSEQGLSHFNHFSLLVQLARDADQKRLKHISMYFVSVMAVCQKSLSGRDTFFQMCHFIMGLMVHKSSRSLIHNTGSITFSQNHQLGQLWVMLVQK